jgi:hypothetical protein
VSDEKQDFENLVDEYRIACYDFKEACRSNSESVQDFYSETMEKKRYAIASAYEVNVAQPKNMRELILGIVYDARLTAEEKVDQIMTTIGVGNEM